jgi:hypothetical protein
MLITAPDFPCVAGVLRRTDIHDGNLAEIMCQRSRGHHQ